MAAPGPSSAATATSAVTETVTESTTAGDDDARSLHLRLHNPANATTTTANEEEEAGPPQVRWTPETVDNEHMGRKKSKCCCVYGKPKRFGESDDESDEECETPNCRGHVEKKHKPHKCGGC